MTEHEAAIIPSAYLKVRARNERGVRRRVMGVTGGATVSGQFSINHLDQPLDAHDVHEVDLERPDRLRHRARKILRLELALDLARAGKHAECGVFEDVWRNAVEIADKPKRLDSPARARLGLAPQEAFSQRSHASMVESESRGGVPRTRYPPLSWRRRKRRSRWRARSSRPSPTACSRSSSTPGTRCSATPRARCGA